MADLRIDAAALARDVANKERQRANSAESRITVMESDMQDLRSLVAKLVQILVDAGLVES